MDEAAGLSTLLTMVLLDDATYKTQRNALIDFAKATPAKDPSALGAAVHSAMCDQAYRLFKGHVRPVRRSRVLVEGEARRNPAQVMNDDLQEVRARIAALRDSLPRELDAAHLGVRLKAPFQLLCTRQALMWRMEELARTACDALEREDLAAAALLARATLENTAVAWKMMETLENRENLSPKELNDTVMQMLGGAKMWNDAPQAFNTIGLINRMDKTVPGTARAYGR
jgi:hypothetical protein